ncbi:hypothetical protein AN61_01414 [Mycobacterium tuberculosis M1232]|nr:hypothetical protein AN61_01414 [Mycobacterium tuberculosis M1232]
MLTADSHVVRPKTPRGDGNQVSNGGGNLAATGRSSDPKPREGTETRMVGKLALGSESSRQTQNPERGRKHFDDNSLTTNFQSRQTQNPERGRKHSHEFPSAS